MRLSLVLGLALLASGAGAQVPRAQCFPVEELPPALRPKAEAMLLKALDSEALFTVVGGLKPMSSGWVSTRFAVDKPDLREAEEMRRILRTFRVGDELSASLTPFWRVYDGQRYLDGAFFHRRSMSETVRRHADFFGFYGVTPSSSGEQIVAAFETDATSRRNFGYGVLFGYPHHAVRFFVEASESQRKDGKLVPRDFLSIPVFVGPTHHFVYAVPKGHLPNADDLVLRERAAPILAKYRTMRAEYIGPGKKGVVQMLRDWMDDGKGRCSPETALRKTRP
ncbi:MAG: hypothetical protein ACO1SV_26255 [Fimbriimonas sp.]